MIRCASSSMSSLMNACFLIRRTYASIKTDGVALETLKRISRLEKVLEQKILKERVIWQPKGIIGCTVNLGDGITANVFVGAEETETVVRVSDGVETICREIPEYWLANWEVARDQKETEKHT